MAEPRQAVAITRRDWEELRDRLKDLETGQTGIQKSLLEHYEQERGKFAKIEEDSIALISRVVKIEDTEAARKNWAIGAITAIGLLWPIAWEKIKLFFR